MEKTEGKWEIISNGKTRQMPDYKDDNTAYIDCDKPLDLADFAESVRDNADVVCAEEEMIFSFTRLPNFIKDTRLSLAAKELLLYLQADCDEGGKILGRLSLEKISIICGKDEFAIWNAWKELKKFEYVIPY